jgi:lipopolysaccharide/colanic/teichoic acid biosynthesis glycosyltransferase
VKHFDLFGVLIIVLFCLGCIILALLIKNSSKGPVLFKQWRTGKNDPFVCYKFQVVKPMYDDKHKRKGMSASRALVNLLDVPV